MIEPLSNKDAQRVIGLIFNGLSQQMTTEGIQALLSTRMRFATAVYQALCDGDVEDPGQAHRRRLPRHGPGQLIV